MIIDGQQKACTLPLRLFKKKTGEGGKSRGGNREKFRKRTYFQNEVQLLGRLPMSPNNRNKVYQKKEKNRCTKVREKKMSHKRSNPQNVVPWTLPGCMGLPHHFADPHRVRNVLLDQCALASVLLQPMCTLQHVHEVLLCGCVHCTYRQCRNPWCDG